MTNLLKFLVAVASLAMIVFYGVYTSNVIFDYIPYDSFFISLLDNMVYFMPMIICAMVSIIAINHVFPPVSWFLLVIWIIIMVCSFIPGSILGLFA